MASEIPYCNRCSGLVKPSITFFGESLPRRFSTQIEKVRAFLNQKYDRVQERITHYRQSQLTDTLCISIGFSRVRLANCAWDILESGAIQQIDCPGVA